MRIQGLGMSSHKIILLFILLRSVGTIMLLIRKHHHSTKETIVFSSQLRFTKNEFIDIQTNLRKFSNIYHAVKMLYGEEQELPRIVVHFRQNVF